MEQIHPTFSEMGSSSFLHVVYHLGQNLLDGHFYRIWKGELRLFGCLNEGLRL